MKRSLAKAGPFVQIAEVGTTTYTDLAVVNGTKYLLRRNRRQRRWRERQLEQGQCHPGCRAASTNRRCRSHRHRGRHDRAHVEPLARGDLVQSLQEQEPGRTLRVGEECDLDQLHRHGPCQRQVLLLRRPGGQRHRTERTLDRGQRRSPIGQDQSFWRSCFRSAHPAAPAAG